MPVTWHDLEFALLAGNAGPGVCSWIHEQTSQVRLSFSEEEGDGPPPDGETGWHQLPDAKELDLKKRLVDNFVADECPTLREEVRRCFSHRGAWRAFKDLLARRRLLDQWHHYENAATRRALMAWAAERGIEVVDGPVDGGPTKALVQTELATTSAHDELNQDHRRLRDMNAKTEEIICHRASYVADLTTFRQTDPHTILGKLAQGQTGDLNPAQRDAWLQQIEILKRSLSPALQGIICFEFVIPRIGKRADNVLLIGDQVIVIEFKIGADSYDQMAKNQAVDYALDLKNFHVGCHAAVITPVLVATKAPLRVNEHAELFDGVYPPLLANSQSLAGVISFSAARARPPELSHRAWLEAGYRPTPTIVEASQALYRGHQVSDITHSEAGADNLGVTTVAISRIIDQARSSGRKAICLVSGVPGAGKTLAGLNLVCQRRQRDGEGQEHAVFLSGNGPLVKVLQEALTRDEVAQFTSRGEHINKSEAQRKAHTFIQNIHHFRDEYLIDHNPPVERVVVFDEAQRAWNREQTSKFMQQKRGQSDFAQSEPEFLISVMDRHPTWAVIVCLIGGGQEINTGEAGLEEWLRALREHFPHWQVHLPDRLDATDYLPTFKLSELGERVIRETSLHLGVSLRSFRSERLSAAVAALMSGQTSRAVAELAIVLPLFPIVITRSLERAKTWVRERARGSERFGLLASSGGKRLKPLGITMDVQVDPCVWFLNPPADVRSSFYLEDAASEFDVQGLELDWTIVAWDGDLIHQPTGWRYRAFKGTRWQEIRDADAQRYRLNAYRVLLTRARQGMVIVVPAGDPADQTRSPEYYDPTWRYLRSLGLPELPTPQTL